MSDNAAQLTTERLQWMSSHVTDAPFPTPESKAGLQCYLDNVDTTLALSSAKVASLDLTVYPVDCHPLMIRYARVLSQRFTENDRPLVIEYLTQLDPDPTGRAQLFVGYHQQQPVACGMTFGDDTHVMLADCFSLIEGGAEAMQNHLIGQESRQVINE